MGIAVISGATFSLKSVTYYEVAGNAIVEGDISLGSVEDVKASTETARAAVAADPSVAFSVGITGSQFRWPNREIPYEIDVNLPYQQRVTDAIAHWEANTDFRFPVRTPANAGQYPNWVLFTDAGGCWSMVGLQSGQQTISLGGGCDAGSAIHEIGHAVGLWHEQGREDRDLFVTINWQNIQSGMAAQFNQHITDGDDLGAYDYGSIMHYPRWAFSSNGQDTITPLDPNAQIGQRIGLSAGDIAGVHAMYPLRVPDVVGTTRAYAGKVITKAGLVPKFAGLQDAIWVISQSPEAGESAEPGSTVTMQVRKQKATRTAKRSGAAKTSTSRKRSAAGSVRTTYHVSPRALGGWQVAKEGAPRPSSRHDTKAEAVARGRELTRKQALGQLVVHGADGRIQNEYTYGADPRRSPG